MSRRGVGGLLLLGLVMILVMVSSQLAALRIYHVDECQNIYMARVLALGLSTQYFTSASLFLMGPLSWLARHAQHSSEFFNSARLLFLGVFWLNLFLMARLASSRLVSIWTLLALAGAATLAPLWDYGFEIRHDNVLLTGLLLSWWMIRERPAGAWSFALAGALGAVLVFIAVKAVVYVLPIAAVALLFPPSALRHPRWKLALYWGGGALIATLLIRLAYGSGGGWQTYFSLFNHVAEHTGGSRGGARFWPWATLGRLLSQTPLLVAMTLAAAADVLYDLFRRRRGALNWDGLLPELLLLGWMLAVLLINPTPFAYNLVNLVPFAFLLAFKYARRLCGDLAGRSALWPAAVAVLLFAHLSPFVLATRRHFGHPNTRQETLMRLAEDLTDPESDFVYDAAGMVPTRSSVDFYWYLHSLETHRFIDGSGRRLHQVFAGRPPSVVIRNYRFDWLPGDDREYIESHYVPLSDELWVLGKILARGGGAFEVQHAGRYRLSTLGGSDLADTYPNGIQALLTPEETGALSGSLDGLPLTNQVVRLSAGVHQLQCAQDTQPAVVWLGPEKSRIHRVPNAAHQLLFINWY